MTESESERFESDSEGSITENENQVETGSSFDSHNLFKLSKENLEAFQKKIEKTGVVYLSRVPPFMKPQKLKSLLTQCGAEINRVYLVPEDPKITARRKKYKRNRRQNYVEGWVEFMDKSQAKRLVEHLNNKPIGGSKRNYYHDDIWNLKYLPKFKWNNLTDQLAYEKAVKEQRLRLEMSQARKEAEDYMNQVEKAKIIKKAKTKKEFEFRQRKPKNLERDVEQRKDNQKRDNPHKRDNAKRDNLLMDLF